jgi:hypothetical protein
MDSVGQKKWSSGTVADDGEAFEESVSVIKKGDRTIPYTPHYERTRAFPIDNLFIGVWDSVLSGRGLSDIVGRYR